MRVLDKRTRSSSTSTSSAWSRRVTRALRTRPSARPHGAVLVTGPTGSGKTTTLYAALQMLNTPEKNIITVEDPVEYEIAGLTQVQVTTEDRADLRRRACARWSAPTRT